MAPTDWGGGAGAGIAQSLDELGRMQARRAQQQGQIWGNAISNIGSSIGNAIEQAPVRAALAQERQARALQLQALTQDQQEKAQQLAEARAGDQALAQAIADPANGGDPQKIADAVGRTHPTAAAHYLTLATQHQEALDKLAGFANTQHQTAADVLGSIDDPTDDTKVKNGLALLKTKGLSQPLLDQIAGSMDQQGAPATIAQLVASAPETVKAQRAAAAELNKPMTAAEGAVVNTPARGQAGLPPLITGQPKAPTKWALAADAANRNSPTQQQSKDALAAAAAGTPKEPNEFATFQNTWASVTGGMGTNWSDLTPQQQMAGIEKFKTMSTDASALAAANRQVESIAAQIASQRRGQDFEIAKQARTEYTNNVAKPWQTAQQSADTLRALVTAAKAGNNIAGAMQNLQTTMTAIRENGLNRLNTTELGVPAEAGSLGQRLEGRIGALVSGGSKKIPDDLQNDMVRFADLMEKQAKLRYQRGRSSLLKTYQGVDLPDESGGAATGGPDQPLQVGGFSIRVK